MTARNPKGKRLMVRITETIDEQLIEVADAIGLNKGAAATVAIGLGLAVLRGILAGQDYLRSTEVLLPRSPEPP